MMKNFKFFALASVALFAACSNEENPVVEQNESTLALRLETPALSRAIESPIGTENDDVAVNFKDVTLYFWTDANGTTAASPASMQLSTAQIEKAKESDGTMIRVPANTLSVSMTANNSVDPISVINYQGKNVLTEIPLSAPATQTVQHSTINNAKKVTLKPTLDMARIEVSGKIEAKENQKAPDGKKQAYKTLKVDAIYVNNYKETQGATGLKKFTKDNWDSFEGKMYDEISAENATALANKSKAAAFQIFPTTYTAGQDNMSHIVLKISYEYNDYVKTTPKAGTGYLTIKNFKAGNDYISFLAGTIYKMDLASLNDKFGTDDSGNPINPLDPDPEMDKTNLYLTIEAVKWTHKNITPDI